MVRNIFILAFVVILFGCNKEEEKQLLEPTFFELNTACFSTIKLDQAEVVIDNASDYKTFQDTIKRYFFPYCDTINLPEINFDEAFFAGKFTETGGCNVTYNRQVFYLPESNRYEYHIDVTAEGLCDMLHTSFNSAIIPLNSVNVQVQFQVNYFSN